MKMDRFPRKKMAFNANGLPYDVHPLDVVVKTEKLRKIGKNFQTHFKKQVQMYRTN